MNSQAAARQAGLAKRISFEGLPWGNASRVSKRTDIDTRNMIIRAIRHRIRRVGLMPRTRSPFHAESVAGSRGTPNRSIATCSGVRACWDSPHSIGVGGTDLNSSTWTTPIREMPVLRSRCPSHLPQRRPHSDGDMPLWMNVNAPGSEPASCVTEFTFHFSPQGITIQVLEPSHWIQSPDRNLFSPKKPPWVHRGYDLSQFLAQKPLFLGREPPQRPIKPRRQGVKIVCLSRNNHDDVPDNLFIT